jgi:hypothetical protein
MAKYNCNNCGQVFDRITTLNKHLSRKIQCIKKFESKTNKKVHDPKCDQCGRFFSRKDSLQRHMKICKGNINKKIIKGDIKKTVKGDKKIIKGDRNTMGKKITAANGKKSIAVTGDNNKVNSPIINLFFFGKDGVEHLNINDFLKIIKSNKNLYEALITEINFDPSKPEHHNVYYPDLKSSCGKIYENNKWVNKKIHEIIDTLLDAKTDDLNTILDKFDGVLSKKIRQKIIDTIRDVDYSNPTRRKKLISYIKPILHDNKEIVIKTKKILEKLRKDDEYADEDVFKKGTKLRDVKKLFKK